MRKGKDPGGPKHTDPDPEHCLLLYKPGNYFCDAVGENSMPIVKEGSAHNIEESFGSRDPDKIMRYISAECFPHNYTNVPFVYGNRLDFL
jgi:hypothetical protein